MIKTKKTFLCNNLQKKDTDYFKNIILITLDAFNFELLEKNIDSLPNFKKLKENGVFFTNTFSIGPTTPFSFPGIIGGVYPYGFGIGINKKVETLDFVLAENRYNTAFINEAQAFLTPYFGYGKKLHYSKNFLELSHAKIDRKDKNIFLKSKPSYYKINHFRIMDKIRKYQQNISNKKIKNFIRNILNIIRFINLYFIKNFENINDRETLHEQFISEIENFINKSFKRPQFLWIHTIVNHLPYLPSNDIKFSKRKINYLNYRGISRFINHSCAQELKYLFVESLKTADTLIEKIINTLKMNNHLDNSIIIITADHGEEFLEDGFFGHVIESSSDRLLRVPLIFFSPIIFGNKIISVPVSTIDILPTIVDLLNIKKPITSQGISLKNIILNDLHDLEDLDKFWKRPIYSEGWKNKHLLDRSPGYESKERVFTVRMEKYKLKLEQKLNNYNEIFEKYDLKNWIKNEKIDINKNILIFEKLKKLLHEHIHNQLIFACAISN